MYGRTGEKFQITVNGDEYDRLSFDDTMRSQSLLFLLNHEEMPRKILEELADMIGHNWFDIDERPYIYRGSPEIALRSKYE